MSAELQRMDGSWAEATMVVQVDMYYENFDGAFRLTMQTCGELDCIFGYIPRPNASNLFCQKKDYSASVICDPYWDREICCMKAAGCANYTWCEFGMVIDYSQYCAGVECVEGPEDEASCCKAGGRCAYDLRVDYE